VDRHYRLLPAGVPGEITVGGAGVARGYLNNPELTAEKFVLARSSWLIAHSKNLPAEKRMPRIDPTSCELRAASYRLYRTGDLARWLEDGNIEFLGRIDYQVKIRGYRIELGEIENRLLKHEQVKEAVVIAREDKDNDKCLCAYVVTTSNLDMSGLKDYLALSLPDYMIPALFVPMQQLPLTANGKIDRRALPVPLLHWNSRQIPGPGSSTEEKLIGIWKKVLNIGPDVPVGIDDDFFKLGGHSLKATLLLSNIQKTFEKDIPMKAIFENSSLEQLAGYIDRTTGVPAFYTPIRAAEKREYYPLSPAQKRLYILRQMDGPGTVYNIPYTAVMEGEPDKKRLEETFRASIRRHESLRTSFHTIDGDPVQRVHDQVEFEIEENGLDDSAANRANRHEEKIDSMINGFIRPFDLSLAPLLRVSLNRLAEKKFLFLVDMHHITADGVSMAVLVKEFTSIYSGKEPAPLRIQYKDYCQWLHLEETSAAIERQASYWLKRFPDDIPCLDLPTDYPRPAVQRFEGQTQRFGLTTGQAEQVNRWAGEEGATLFMALLTLFHVMLSKLCGQDDIVIGTPVAGRPHNDCGETIGMFVNTLALRNDSSKHETGTGFLQGVKQDTLDAFENRGYPFEELVETVAVRRDPGRSPLFDVMMVLQNIDIDQLEIPGLVLRSHPFTPDTAKFDMVWTFTEPTAGKETDFTVEYCTALFKKETINRFAAYFKRIVETITVNPTVRLVDIEIISPDEKEDILYGFNRQNLRVGYPEDKTIHRLFEEQVERTPHGVALVGVNSKQIELNMTYRMLNERSNQLAYVLIERGVAANFIVGIMVERSLEMIIAILGILKAGGTYLPIDPEYPEERIDYMLADSNAKMLLTTDLCQKAKNINFDDHVVYLPLLSPFSSVSSVSSVAKNPAYVIYTSGTTGRPKGTAIEHGNVTRLMINNKFQFQLGPGDTWTLFHSFCFDFSVWEMYGALLYGGKLAIVPRQIARDTTRFLALLKRETVTVLNQTPSSFYQVIAEELKAVKKELHLRYVILGGEALNPSKLKQWQQRYPHTRTINMYGITETTVHVTFKEITDTDVRSPVSNIGIAIPTLALYVMDRHSNLLPPGVPGELWVGGAGVARGYLNRPELTAEKFVLARSSWLIAHSKNIPDEKEMPWTDPASYRLYRTGDLVKQLPAGEMEYLGRIDQQVKIRGFRIEPGEIESQLLACEGVREAVVVPNGTKDGDSYLSAYIVPHAPGELDIEVLRAHLSGKLPAYMIPSYFISMPNIPLTANGKLDIHALPDPKSGSIHGKYTAPRSETEAKLVEILSRVLGMDRDVIGIHTDFFQVGGHSLKALALVNAVHKEFQVKISIHDIFQSPTAAELAVIIRGHEVNPFTGIEPLPGQEYYELSYAQKRLWVLQKRNPHSQAFNMPEKVTLYEAVEIDTIRAVTDRLTARHESLRTCFKEVDGQVVQQVLAQVTVPITAIDLSRLGEEEQLEKRNRLLSEESLIPFDLEKAPLLRMKLVKIHEREFDLLFNMHHLVSDGWSMVVLGREFHSYYQAFKQGRDYNPPPVRIQYKDWAHWHNKLLTDREKKSEVLETWKKLLTGPVSPLELPYDFPASQLTSKESSGYRALIDSETTVKLNALARDFQASLFMVLLAGFNLLLHRLTGQEELLIGMPGAARQHGDIENTIGLFVNTLVLKTRVDKDEVFENFLRTIQGHTMKMLEYQHFPLELICDELGIKYPDLSLFFNMVNTGDSGREPAPPIQTGHIEKVQEAKFEMAFYITDYKDGIDIMCNYYSQLFRPETVEKAIRQYINLLKMIAEDPEKRLKEYRATTKKKLLKKPGK
jgi:amino acid adenylation domain-containing protein